jgi:hypothetical protein
VIKIIFNMSDEGRQHQEFRARRVDGTSADS